MLIGLVLVTIGIVFFARALGYIEGDTLNVLWPLLLIVLGIGMISNRAMGHQCKGGSCWCGGEVDWSKKKKKK